jgi:hypothetical protein
MEKTKKRFTEKCCNNGTVVITAVPANGSNLSHLDTASVRIYIIQVPKILNLY